MTPRTRRGPNTPVNNTNPNNMTPESIQAMIDQALLRNSTNGDGSHSSHEDNRRNVQIARPCFYTDFMKCQPLNFKGAEGVVGLTRWIEKMELVFNISGCTIENQVKFATCTLLGAALTWWNGQIRTLGPEAYAMTWEVLKKKMTDKYCPQGEIKKLEIELWNLKVKGNDVPAYTERFQELTLICTKFVANETEKVDKYISGLPDNIYGNVKSARPKTLDETIELANDLMDQKLRTYAERQSDNKRKADDSSRNNHGHQQQPFKRQNVAKVYNMGTGERKPYGGSLPKCTKCHLHHNGPCTQKCHKCNKVGHFARDCRSTGNTNVANTQKGNGAAPKGNRCFECGAPGHFKRDCPKLKNKDGGNGSAQGWVYAVGNAEKRGNAPGNPLMANGRTSTWPKDAQVIFGTRYTPKKGLPPARPVEFQIDLIPRAASRCCRHRYAIRLTNAPARAPILALPEGSEDFVVYCDASHKGLGVVLMQREKVIAYASRTHKSSRERTYPLHDFELGERKRIGRCARAVKKGFEPLGFEPLVIDNWLDHPKNIRSSDRSPEPENLVNEDRKEITSVLGPRWAEAQLTGPELIQETTEKIVLVKQRMQAAQNRQKSYADQKRKPMEFEIGDRVMLKVSPWKGVIRFGKRGKLNPRFVGPFKVLAKVRKVAYRLELPQELSRVHHTFHVSNLKKMLQLTEPLVMPLDREFMLTISSVCGRAL
ncbi:putative reverse transcriptase domain-containing protein [Tanacetum coccineum]|uniref:Reverse transcriptase domain-containing protein n=1 Tax=Tanacetum coccineum TaxID=301880 RepID=A0ABQ5AS79_9ASTR